MSIYIDLSYIIFNFYTYIDIVIGRFILKGKGHYTVSRALTNRTLSVCVTNVAKKVSDPLRPIPAAGLLNTIQ